METDKNAKRENQSYISAKRATRPAPIKLIDEKGKANFGTFDSYIEELNILDCKKAVKGCPKCLNKFRVKQWQAFQINFDEGFLLGAIYSLGYIMANIVVFYDKKTKKVLLVKKFSLVKKSALVTTLKDEKIMNKAGGVDISIYNNLANGKCTIDVEYKKKKKVIISANVTMSEIAKPSVCVMPLGENRPLYSHKALFSMDGNVVVNDKNYKLSNARGIIDDHKGYYPRVMRYDWVTGVGKENGIDIGFNLTDNQVIDKENYNENFLWYNGEIYPLPPIKICHTAENEWTIKDELGKVDIKMCFTNGFKINLNVLLVQMKYFAPFGEYNGYIYDTKGVKHIIDGAFGMGEDKKIVI